MRRCLSTIVTLLLIPAALAQSPSANGHKMILTGEMLRSNEYLANNGFVLVMQPDGNLCEYFGTSSSNLTPNAIWCSNTKGTGSRFNVQMHYTNNFCVTTGDEWGQGPALWCTNQVGSGTGPAFAILNGDGNFFIQQGTPSAPGALLWQTGIVFAQVEAAAPSGGSIQWPDGRQCPPVCAQVFRVGSNATLTAATAPNTFKQWTGRATSDAGCAGLTTPACTITVKAWTSLPPISAQYVARMTVQNSTGNALQFAGTNCVNAACTKDFTVGEAVTIQAPAGSAYSVESWSGACTGQGPVCIVSAQTSSTPIVPAFAAPQPAPPPASQPPLQLPSNPIAAYLNAAAAFNLKRDMREPVGYILSMAMPAIPNLKSDLQVLKPGPFENQVVFAVMEGYSWSGGVNDPIVLTARVSTKNRQELAMANHSLPKNTEARFRFIAYGFDSFNKVWYRQFDSNDLELKGTFVGGFTIGDPAQDVKSPENWPVQFTFAPQPAAQFLHFAQSPSLLPWGAQ